MKKILMTVLLAGLPLIVYSGINELKIATIKKVYSPNGGDEMIYKLGTAKLKKSIKEMQDAEEYDAQISTGSNDLGGQDIQNVKYTITPSGKVKASFKVYNESINTYYTLKCSQKSCLIDNVE